MARTLLSALAVIALLACGGGAKKPASQSRTPAAGPAATRPSATTPKTSVRTKSTARKTTATRDTTQKNPLTNRP